MSQAHTSNHDSGICPCQCFCGVSCDHKTCACADCVKYRDEASRGLWGKEAARELKDTPDTTRFPAPMAG